MSRAAQQGLQPSSPFKNTYFTEMRSGSKAGSYLRLVDFVSLNSWLESTKEEKNADRDRKEDDERRERQVDPLSDLQIQASHNLLFVY